MQALMQVPLDQARKRIVIALLQKIGNDETIVSGETTTGEWFASHSRRAQFDGQGINKSYADLGLFSLVSSSLDLTKRGQTWGKL